MNDQHRPTRQTTRDDEISLNELFGVLWSGRWLIGGITTAAAVLAIIFSLMLPDIYQAEALLAPNDPEGSGGLAALADGYGGIAGLAGINLNSGAPDKTAIGLKVLKSRKFISEFIERHDIIVPLMAASGWNRETGELEIDASKFDVTAGKWVRKPNPPRGSTPSTQEAFEAFQDVLSVGQDKKSGLVTIAVQHYSPTVAKEWVDWLVRDINLSTMRQDVEDAEQAIAYLDKQIEGTSLADLQNVFFNLIEEQTKTVMLAKVTDEYLLRTLDPAVVPEIKSSPKRSLIVIASTVFGFFLAVAAVLMWTSLRRNRSS